MGDFRLDALAGRVRAELGDDPSRWYVPDGYDSVAMAVLDSIYSTGHHYASVTNALAKYEAARRAEGADPSRDSAADLVSAAEAWGGVPGLVERTNNWPTSTKPGAPRKAEAAIVAARLLDEYGLGTVAAVCEQLGEPAAQEASPAKRDWLRLRGQGSGLTWTYFLMLCGEPGVKADRMVVRFVDEALGEEVTSREAATLVGQVADELGVARSVLDHAIWRFESGRPYLLDEAAVAGPAV